MAGAMPESVTSVPLTPTEPTVISAPSVTDTANALAGGAPAALASSVSSKTMTSDVPAAGTLADCGRGPAMSAVVALSTFDARPVPASLIASTR